MGLSTRSKTRPDPVATPSSWPPKPAREAQVLRDPSCPQQHTPESSPATRSEPPPDGRSFQLLDLIDGQPAQVFAKAMGTPRYSCTNDRGRDPGHPPRGGRRAPAHARHHSSRHQVGQCDGSYRSERLPDRLRLGHTPRESSNTRALRRDLLLRPAEQIRGEAVDGRADIYAMGVLLYRMLCGRRPFEGRDHRSIDRPAAVRPATPARRAGPRRPPSGSSHSS